MVFNFIIYMVW